MNSYMEYAILRQINAGTPFIHIITFKSFQSAKDYLQNIFIDEHEKRNKMYFVDNEFYKNNYSNLRGIGDFYYYKIVERKVTSWENYNYFKNSEDKDKQAEKSNIIKFPNLA